MARVVRLHAWDIHSNDVLIAEHGFANLFDEGDWTYGQRLLVYEASGEEDGLLRLNVEGRVAFVEPLDIFKVDLDATFQEWQRNGRA